MAKKKSTPWVIMLKGVEYRLQEMTRDDLLDLKILVDQEGDLIKAQLYEAKAAAHETGIYANPDWYKRASIALSYKRRNSQKIQHLCARLKKEQKQKNSRTFESFFIDVAKDLLLEDTFFMLFNEAKERANSDNVMGLLRQGR